MPSLIIDILRYFDSFGGLKSNSINRLMASNASRDARVTQLFFNKTTTTFVLKKTLAGVIFMN